MVKRVRGFVMVRVLSYHGAAMEFERYREAVRFLEGLQNLPVKNYMADRSHPEIYLKRMRSFLALLGNPERGMKFVHVTGTSGKGTVTTMLHEIFDAAGKRVGSFTSPFTMTTIEKIRVGKLFIASDVFADLVDEIKPALDRAQAESPYGAPSYFEICFAIAFLYFRRERCEWIVLEAGCGGRYDASNVISHPAVTAITNIDLDHTQLLGKSLGKIAFDKAGIIKKGSAFFTAETRPALRGLFMDICRLKGAAFHLVDPSDDYQETNRALAGAIARHLGLPEKAIAEGAAKARLPCRFEIMQTAPLVVLDGAHNRAKIASTVANLARLRYRHLHLIVGMADNKDHFPMLAQIIPRADRVSFTRFQTQGRLCADPNRLCERSKRFLKKGVRTDVFLDPARALAAALRDAKKGDLVLVTGSFFLTGELRTHWIPENAVLRARHAFPGR